MAKRILFVLTSNDRMGESGEPTGAWAEEFAVPYYALLDAGHEIDVATPKGGAVPFDPRSIEEPGKNPPEVERLRNDKPLQAMLESTMATATLRPADYDAIFLPGGHGTMWDLPDDVALAKIVGELFDAGKPVAAVCHGPAGLVRAKRSDGQPIVAGRRVNSFLNAEEDAVGLRSAVPFLLEDKLRELGGNFEAGEVFKPYVVRDGHLITGQNPQSSGPAARELIAVLKS